MSLILTNRLDKIENDIRLMIMLQKCGGCQQSQGGTCISPANGIPKREASLQIKSNVGVGASVKEQKPAQRCSTCPTERKPVKCTFSSDCSPPGVGRHTSQVCCCAPSKPPPVQLCKCGKSPIKELEYEKEKRMRMEEEVHKMKIQIAEMMQSKCMALNMTKQLKQKYEKMKSTHEETSSQLSTLTHEKELLCRCLEKEKLQRIRSRGESGVQVLTKDIDKTAMRKLQDQDAKIRSLNNSVLSLTQTVEEKDLKTKQLEHEKHKIHEKLVKNKDMAKKVSEMNAKLAKSVKQKHDSFMVLRDRANKYQKQMGEYKNEVRRSQLEVEKLKTDIKKHKEKGGDSLQSTQRDRSLDGATKEKDIESIQEKLKATKEKERKASETIQLLNNKIRDLEAKDTKGLEREMQRLNKDFKALQIKYEEALKKVKQFENADSKQTETLKQQMKKFSDGLVAKEGVYIEEKEKLGHLVDELQTTIDQQRQRIDELIELQKQQDAVIKTQSEQLVSKEEQIKLRDQENDIVKEQYFGLGTQIRSFNEERGEFGSKSGITQRSGIGAGASNSELLRARIIQLSDEVVGLKAALKDEQENSHMKDKVIEDQYNTMRTLKKEKSQMGEEIKRINSESVGVKVRAKSSQEQLDRTSRQLAKEQELKRRTESDLKNMEKKQKKLEEEVGNLEGAYKEISTMSVQKLNEGKKVLEQQMDEWEIQQQEWEEERKKIEDERDRAIGAAKLATRTLVETMDDFQGQIKSQQKLQKIVTNIISTKNDQVVSPCVRRMECNKQMQLAIPCKPVMPPCYRSVPNDEDDFYTASSGRASSTRVSVGMPTVYGLYGPNSKYQADDRSQVNCTCVSAFCQCPRKTNYDLPTAGQKRKTCHFCKQHARINNT